MERKVSSNEIHRNLGSKGIFIVISFIIIALIVDTSIVKISAFTGGLNSPGSNIAIFTVMALIFGIGQYLILGFVGRSNYENGSSGGLRFSTIHKSVSIIKYSLLAIFGALILQMALTSSYNILFLEIIIWINYGVAIALLAFLSQRFLSWFRSNHNPVVLAYTLAIMAMSINAVFTLVYVTNELAGKPVNVLPTITPVGSYSSAYNILNSGYVTTSVVSFILTWIGAALLLQSYSRKLGRARYRILVSIPLLYFLSQFQPIFLDIFAPFRLSEPILFGVVYTLFFSASIPVGGVLFGIAFWSVARNISRDVVKQYMMISAYGMMLLFSSNQASGLVLVPYPPFGLATISFFGLASYLVFIGIYSSAISVAQDSGLRQSIRSVAMKESRLLDSIGMAQMEQEIQKKVIAITKQNQDRMTEESGVQPSLTEEEIRQYLDEVLNEVKKGRQHHQ